MQALFNKVTKGSDLYEGQAVLVRSVNGDLDFGHDLNYAQVVIRKIEPNGDGFLLYYTDNGCAYTPFEMILFKKN